MAESVGAFYLALSQSLEAANPVASYVTLYYAVQQLLARLEQAPNDAAAKAQTNSAFAALESKKRQLGPLPGCKLPYEDFLRQLRAANNANYPHCLRALSLFGEIGPEWQQSSASLPSTAASTPTSTATSSPDQARHTSLSRSAQGMSLSGASLQVLEQAKEQILDAVQEFEFRKVAEGRQRLEAALQMLSQLG